MRYKVSSDENYSLQLRQDDTVRSILQNISVLLNTRRGSAPMYREFGLPMAFIDKPINVAETIAFSEISEALEEYEPRAKLKDLRFEKSTDGRMIITVEVDINE